ncbi:MAG: arsenate reductase ArsC [Nitrososphaerota archaeon]|nr:arsenate reductase ArsC [Nitrososphaerota archaeon]
MAEAFARRAGLDASSAGTVPASSVNRVVVEAMAEKGFDLSHNKPKTLSLEMIDRADIVVTMGCSVEKVCPRPMLKRMRKKVVDWGLEDPKGKSLPEVRRIRDEIEGRVEELAQSARRSS